MTPPPEFFRVVRHIKIEYIRPQKSRKLKHFREGSNFFYWKNGKS
jgi:hypothetical protein